MEIATTEKTLTDGTKISKCTFGSGLVAEAAGLKVVDGTATFNIENMVGTLIHAAAGYFAGWGLRKAIKPEYKGVFKRG